MDARPGRRPPTTTCRSRRLVPAARSTPHSLTCSMPKPESRLPPSRSKKRRPAYPAQANALTANADLAATELLSPRKKSRSSNTIRLLPAATSPMLPSLPPKPVCAPRRKWSSKPVRASDNPRLRSPMLKSLPKQISVTEARARAGEAQAARSKASLDQAQLNLSYTKIIAPVDGVVGNRNAR